MKKNYDGFSVIYYLMFFSVLIFTFGIYFYITLVKNNYVLEIDAGCSSCTFTGYKCSGKNAVVCSKGCVKTVSTCPNWLSCNSSKTAYWCYDNCKEGTYKCPARTPEPDDNIWLQKCVDDKWKNWEYGPDGCCDPKGYFSC